MTVLSIENLNWFICNIRFPLKAPSSPPSYPPPSQSTRGKKKFTQHHGGVGGALSALWPPLIMQHHGGVGGALSTHWPPLITQLHGEGAVCPQYSLASLDHTAPW